MGKKRAEAEAGGGAESQDESAIAKDVAAFASTLGFGAGSGFDDRDFRPPSQRIKQDDDESKRKNDRKGADRKAAKVEKGGKDGKGGKEKEHKTPHAVTSRTWKESVGPRPGRDLSAPISVPQSNVSGGKGMAHVLEELLINEPWYDVLSDMSELSEPTAKANKNGKGKDKSRAKAEGLSEEHKAALVKTGRATATNILDQLVKAYEDDHQRNNPADAKWLLTVRKSGTTADKLAAWSVVIQENLPANMRSFQELLKVCTLKGKRQAAQAMEVMVELCASVVLPDRKLRYLHEQPLHLLTEGALQGDANNKVTHEDIRRLVYWHLEDTLKQKYSEFVEALGRAVKDPLEYLKNKAMKACQQLLCSKPEEEGMLLRLLVNKLGDPARKVSSNAGYLLSQVLEQHRAMALIVAREVEGFLFRPGLPVRSRYSAIIFLNQINFSHSDVDVALAAKLINAYFTMFKVLLKDSENEHAKADSQGQMPDVDARILSAIITGVRRAFPYVKQEDADRLIDEHTPHLFALAHYEHSFPTAVQALSLLYQILSSHQAISDRFYRALYGALLSPALPTSSKAAMLLALVYKSLKEDVSDKRAAAFIKRTLQVVTHAPSGFACGALLVVSELLKVRTALWGQMLQAEEHDDDLERFEDASDDEVAPAPAAARQAPKAKSVGHAAKTNGDKKRAMQGTVIDTGDAEEAGDDLDIDDDDDDASAESGEDSNKDDSGTDDFSEDGSRGEGNEEEQDELDTVAMSDDEEEDGKARSAQGRMATTSSKQVGRKDHYDMRKREPLYAKAEEACFWELCALRQHSHPSVAAMARTLLAGVNVAYQGDPIAMLSLSAFLDKFLSRKGKGPGKGGSSKMQPKSGGVADALDDMGALDAGGEATTGQQTAARVGVWSEAFAKLAEEQVGADDVFFHKYYSSKGQKKGKKAKKQEDDVDASGSESEEEDLLADPTKKDKKDGKDKKAEQKEAKTQDKKKGATAAAATDDDDDDDDDSGSDDEEVGDIHLREDPWASDTDDEESKFLDKQLQINMGVKADADGDSDSDGGYDYDDLARAMEESDQEEGGSEDDAGEATAGGDSSGDEEAEFAPSGSDESELDLDSDSEAESDGEESDDDDDDDDEPKLLKLAEPGSDSDEDEDALLMGASARKKGKAGKAGKAMRTLGKASASDFASADDYAEVLEAGGLSEEQERAGGRGPSKRKGGGGSSSGGKAAKRKK